MYFMSEKDSSYFSPSNLRAESELQNHTLLGLADAARRFCLLPWTSVAILCTETTYAAQYGGDRVLA